MRTGRWHEQVLGCLCNPVPNRAFQGAGNDGFLPDGFILDVKAQARFSLGAVRPMAWEAGIRKDRADIPVVEGDDWFLWRLFGWCDGECSDGCYERHTTGEQP